MAELTSTELTLFAVHSGDYVRARGGFQAGVPVTTAEATIMLRAALKPDEPEAWTEGLPEDEQTKFAAGAAEYAIAVVRGDVTRV